MPLKQRHLARGVSLWIGVPLLCALFVALGFQPAGAQGRSHAYAVVSELNLSAGGDWLLADGPVGIGGDLGIVGFSVRTTYHFLELQDQRRLDPFVSAGYLLLTDLNNDPNGSESWGWSSLLAVAACRVSCGRIWNRPDERRDPVETVSVGRSSGNCVLF